MRESDIIAANIRRIRISLGMTQEALAQKCQRSTNQINGYENARYKPTDRLLQILADALGVLPKDLTTPYESDQIDQSLEATPQIDGILDEAKHEIAKSLGVPTEAVRISVTIEI